MSAIKLERLTKRYRNTYGLHEVNLSIEEGETFGLVGRLGAGKTTLVRVLLNFVTPTSGAASILGLDVVRQSARVKSLVGYVPAKVQYYDFMRGYEIFKMVSSVRKAPFPGRQEEYCQILGLNPEKRFRDMPVSDRKKTAIVQALLGEPQVLILDEPTLALDDKDINGLMRLIREQNKQGVTVLFCSQSFEEVQSVCQRTALLQNGVLLREHALDSTFANAHRIRVKTEDNLALALELLQAKGVVLSEGYLSFFTGAGMDEVIKTLSHYEVLDLRVDQPTTEDACLYMEEKTAETEEEPAYV